MREKNQIDELFRRELDGKGLEYTGDRWAHMESLLAKKKGGFYRRAIWYTAALLLLLSTFYFITQNRNTEAIKEKSDLAISSDSGNEPGNNNEIVISENGQKETVNAEEGRSTVSGNSNIEQAADIPDPVVDDNEIAFNLEENSISANNGVWVEDLDNNKIVHREEVHGTDETQIEEPKEMYNMISFSVEPINDIQFDLLNGLSGQIPRIEGADKAFGPNLRMPYVHLYATPYIGRGSVQHRTDRAVAEWKAPLEKTRSFMNYGIDLRLSRSNFSLLSGIGILQWTERTNYIDQIHSYTFDTSYKLVNREYIKRPNGSYAGLIQMQVDTTSHSITDTVYCPDCPVKFSYITVPLAVQYQFGAGKWQYIARAGFTFSFLRKTEGEYSLYRKTMDDGVNVMQTGDPASGYMSGTTVQTGVMLGLSYRIHPLLALKGRLSYNRSLNSMMQLYKQQADFYGLGLGIEYKLF